MHSKYERNQGHFLQLLSSSGNETLLPWKLKLKLNPIFIWLLFISKSFYIKGLPYIFIDQVPDAAVTITVNSKDGESVDGTWARNSPSLPSKTGISSETRSQRACPVAIFCQRASGEVAARLGLWIFYYLLFFLELYVYVFIELLSYGLHLFICLLCTVFYYKQLQIRYSHPRQSKSCFG